MQNSSRVRRSSKAILFHSPSLSPSFSHSFAAPSSVLLYLPQKTRERRQPKKGPAEGRRVVGVTGYILRPPASIAAQRCTSSASHPHSTATIRQPSSHLSFQPPPHATFFLLAFLTAPGALAPEDPVLEQHLPRRGACGRVLCAPPSKAGWWRSTCRPRNDRWRISGASREVRRGNASGAGQGAEFQSCILDSAKKTSEGASGRWRHHRRGGRRWERRCRSLTARSPPCWDSTCRWSLGSEGWSGARRRSGRAWPVAKAPLARRHEPWLRIEGGASQQRRPALNALTVCVLQSNDGMTEWQAVCDRGSQFS